MTSEGPRAGLHAYYSIYDPPQSIERVSQWRNPSRPDVLALASRSRRVHDTWDTWLAVYPAFTTHGASGSPFTPYFRYMERTIFMASDFLFPYPFLLFFVRAGRKQQPG